MQVSKCGNSLVVRLPALVTAALGPKEGDDIEIQVAGRCAFEIVKKPGAREVLARLRLFRGRLPADFRFDRLEANQLASPQYSLRRRSNRAAPCCTPKICKTAS
jgi:antitoxin MazE